MTTYTDIITVDELSGLLGSDTCRIVDCRFDLTRPEVGRQQYEAGHIPGALFADLDGDLAAPTTRTSGRHPLPDVEDFAALVSSWGVDNRTQVVVYDGGSGGLAARLWWLFRWARHESVALLDGGMAAWQAAGGPLEQEQPVYTRSEFSFDPDKSQVISTTEVIDNLTGPATFQLVDARDSDRFRGLREPIDPVAGHIPGALNLPFTQSLDERGSWRDREELGAMWRELLADAGELPPVAMCGSGVTACHLAVSAQLAGLPLPRIYVGSWSEWIRDPQRPVAPATTGHEQK